MAQIIRHRRGSLESLSAATSSFQKGELIIVSGSSNLTTTNGSGMVFAAVESGSIQAVNRFLIGTNAPNVFSSSVYNGLVKGVPYYASGSSTLYLLGEGANTIPDLTGNISNFSSSVATSFSSSNASITSLSASVASVTGDFSSSVATSFSASAASQTALSASVASVTGNFSSSVATSFSASNASIVSLSASVASVTGDFSSSVAQTFTTQSQRISSLESFSGSQLTQNTALATITGSLISSASTAKTTNDSQDVSITNLNSFSASTITSLSELNSYSSSLKQAFTASGANVTFSGDVTIPGNFTVRGTQTIVDSTTVQLGDNIIELNGSAAANGGLYVKDVTNPNTATGSIIWDSTNDYWKAGAKDSESKLLRAGGDNVVTESAQILFTGISGYDTYSGSVSASFASVIANVGSGVGVSITNLNSFSSSTLGRLTNIESFSSSVENRLTEIGVVSGSLIASASTAKTTNDSQGVSITNLNSFSASVNSSVTALNSSSASQQTQLDTLSSKTGSYATTGSNTFNGSQTITGSINVKDSATTFSIVGNGFSETYLQSNGGMLLQAGAGGVQIKSNSLAVDSNLTVGGDISGSTINGLGNATVFSTSVDSRLSNLQSKSASVDISIAALNTSSASQQTSIDALNAYTSSNTSTTALNAHTASANERFTEIGVVSGSLIASASAAKTTNDAQGVSITNINSFSSSVLTQLTEIGVVSGSLIASASAAKTTNDSQGVLITNLNTFSASVNTSVAALNTSSASQQTSIDALNAYTSSNTSTTALNAFTASANERFTEIGVVSGSLIASASAAKTTNDSQGVSITNINSTTASLNTSVTALNTSSASQQISIDALNVVSGSNLVRLSNLEATSASVNTSVAALNSYSSSLKSAFELTGSNVVVLGDLTVKGTTTSVESNTIQLGDNIIELNGTGAANGGLLVKDPTAPNTVSGSLLWDSTNDYWKAGAAGAESKLLRAGGDNVVTASQQILLTQVDGYDTYSGSVATAISASTAAATWTNLNGKPGGIVSGSSQLNGTTISNLSGSFTGSFKGNLAGVADYGQTVAVSSVGTTTDTTLYPTFTTTAIIGSYSSLYSHPSASFYYNGVTRQVNAEGFVGGIYATNGVVSGSSQIDITSTTNYTTFSSSIATSISASVAGATWDNLVGKPGGIVSGSVQVDITATTGFSTFSSSIETRIQTIDGGTY